MEANEVDARRGFKAAGRAMKATGSNWMARTPSLPGRFSYQPLGAHEGFLWAVDGQSCRQRQTLRVVVL
jgi:hypothetical protein